MLGKGNLCPQLLCSVSAVMGIIPGEVEMHDYFVSFSCRVTHVIAWLQPTRDAEIEEDGKHR